MYLCHRTYAEALMKIIDPKKQLFKRLVARTDLNKSDIAPIGINSSSINEQGRVIDYSNFSEPNALHNSVEHGVYTGQKSLSLLFLKATSLVVIMDDRDDVWNNHTSAQTKEVDTNPLQQLLLVKPYKYFLEGKEIYDRTSGSINTPSDTNGMNGVNNIPNKLSDMSNSMSKSFCVHTIYRNKCLLILYNRRNE